jgi:hypothetical protein
MLLHKFRSKLRVKKERRSKHKSTAKGLFATGYVRSLEIYVEEFGTELNWLGINASGGFL